MNETIKVIENRKSVRKYSSAPITEEEKAIILHASLRAPTAGNMMLYSIIEVADQKIKDQLAESCDHQPFIAEAPLVLLYLADYQRYFDFFTFCDVENACREKGIQSRRPGLGDLLLACSDALIAAQTSVITAESLGIGSCYIGDIIEQAEFHRGLFDLPQFTLPIALLVFGRPIHAHSDSRVTSRFDDEFIISKNRYHRLSETEMIKMFEPSARKSYPELSVHEAVKAIGQAVYFRKFVSEFSFEMNRSAEQWIKTWKGCK